MIILALAVDPNATQIAPPLSGYDHGLNHPLQRHLLVGFACFLAVFTLTMIIIYARKELHRRCSKTQLELGQSARKSLSQVRQFSFQEMELATNGFSENRRLGDGGFGTVYAGTLGGGGDVVAVKLLHRSPQQASPQFMAEIDILSRFKHPNLVQLLGCSTDGQSLLLVYEFVGNGTLADHLHTKKSRLPWLTRLAIAIDIAQVLAYLHSYSILHRDVKSTNVLLDEGFHAKLGDFGLSKAAAAAAAVEGHVSIGAQGTAGYLDPEYHQCYALTDKSDVYSFGVLLMELITAKPAVDFSRERVNLAPYAVGMLQAGAFEQIIDPHLEAARNCMVRAMALRVAEIAFQCLAANREDRPRMVDVAAALIHVAEEP
ncbi:LEAF RUST 10 DISEASE-RESISTANCE LOCUS RECEPTOR-LIKE PROTEIN KINASE-like 1.1 isoform X1 [Selaginella moellendorffii]|nr:LEAF RUST 10 DISEASE-RESISTANCE LOCUS RECEPTOR-LIKE PROTEIN KINASE-like 1.1 isoform X1 [Selaginella moellendorffii]|eukprot:XP_024543094.1 LEAF RUST 10 DISEASE-RESISTANCE LOCUS RECEPTOR-LIKE PROTEIN KINASE-like 1.1 isoform X1 [Selaginella moellendorffii]